MPKTWIVNSSTRRRIIEIIDRLPDGWRVIMQGPQRTLEQNDKMWAMLTDLSKQLRWHGQQLSTEDWKIIMMSAVRRDMKVAPNYWGDGFLMLNTSSRSLSKREMSDMIEAMYAYGAARGVDWTEQ
jgi:hypothetical protein